MFIDRFFFFSSSSLPGLLLEFNNNPYDLGKTLSQSCSWISGQFNYMHPQAFWKKQLYSVIIMISSFPSFCLNRSHLCVWGSVWVGNPITSIFYFQKNSRQEGPPRPITFFGVQYNWVLLNKPLAYNQLPFISVRNDLLQWIETIQYHRQTDSSQP